MTRQTRGWVYILHDSQGDLAEFLRERLNKKSIPVFVRSRDAKDLSEEEASELAIKGAFFIIVLETPSLYKNKLCARLLRMPELAFKKRPREKIAVVIDPRQQLPDQRSWHVDYSIDMPQSRKALLENIRRYVDRVKKGVSESNPSKPDSVRGRFVFLSYSSITSKLADLIRDRISKMGMTVWDYGEAPRDSGVHYTNEISKTISKAMAILIVHNAAWENSCDCDKELEEARKHSTTVFWLKCEDTDPPKASHSDEVIDVREHRRDAGFAELEQTLFPRRPAE